MRGIRSKRRKSRRRVMRRGMHPGMAAHGHHHIVLVKSPPRLLSRSRLSSFLGEAADAGAEGAAVVGARLQGGDDGDGDGGGNDDGYVDGDDAIAQGKDLPCVQRKHSRLNARHGYEHPSPRGAPGSPKKILTLLIFSS